LYAAFSYQTGRLFLSEAVAIGLLKKSRENRDDFGLQLLDSQNRIALLGIIVGRHNKGSIIITSQLPVKSWYEIIGEKTIADAILDRLIHQSHRIELGSESMRHKRKLVNQKIAIRGGHFVRSLH